MAKAPGLSSDPRAPARRELGESLRELLDGLSRSAADEPELLELAKTIRQAAARWAALPRAEVEAEAVQFAGMGDFHDRGPIVGLANPIAPPARYQLDRDTGLVSGEVSFGNAYEGAPGIVHGGFLSAVLDEVLGVATICSGRPGMTAELKVRYLGPTPTHTRLEIFAQFDRVEGRRIYTYGELRAGERVTCQAEGVFISVGTEQFETFRQQRDSERA